MKVVFANCKAIVQVHDKAPEPIRGQQMNTMPLLENAWLLVDGDIISDFGSMDTPLPTADQIISLEGKYILPTWCDSHTHIVFAQSREEEFLMKIEGKSYEEIAAAGGGILNSANKVQYADEDSLFNSASERLKQLISLGTGAIEIKSGYGLTPEAECKMLRVIKRLRNTMPIPIKATFLGAHAFPATYKENKEAYIHQIIDEMLPQIANESLADYIDVFCEHGFFTPQQTSKLLTAGANYGLKAKIHANQLAVSGGVQVGHAHQALSVDHLECIDEEVLQILSKSNTIATLLPSCSFFLGIPFAPARELLSHNAIVALASDYNPGSTPSGNLNLVLSLACIKLKMKPFEAINALTVNAAHAMGIGDSAGHIRKGNNANFIITKAIPSLTYLPYSFGENCIDAVYINGIKMTT